MGHRHLGIEFLHNLYIPWVKWWQELQMTMNLYLHCPALSSVSSGVLPLPQFRALITLLANACQWLWGEKRDVLVPALFSLFTPPLAIMQWQSNRSFFRVLEKFHILELRLSQQIMLIWFHQTCNTKSAILYLESR